MLIYQSNASEEKFARRKLKFDYFLLTVGPAIAVRQALYGAPGNIIPPWVVVGMITYFNSILLMVQYTFVHGSVSKIEWQESPTPGVLVYGYTFPFRYPSPASTFYKHGDCKLFLDNPMAQEVIQTLMTKDELPSGSPVVLRGCIFLGFPTPIWQTWLGRLHLRSRSEIKHRDLFLEALVDFGNPNDSKGSHHRSMIGAHGSKPKECTSAYNWGPDEVNQMKNAGNKQVKFKKTLWWMLKQLWRAEK